MKLKIIFFCISVLLMSCAQSPAIKTIDDKQRLIQSLRLKNFVAVQTYSSQLRMTENSQKTINLYTSLFSVNLLKVKNSLSYFEQFYSDMNFIQQSMFSQMAAWLYLKQIYRHEISPPVRILQRKELLLAPSRIDFAACNGAPENKHCAQEERKKLLSILSEQEIDAKLKRMALKDPCVNLSNQPQGSKIANRCLKKSTGDLKIELLPVPIFSYNEWSQAIIIK